MKLILSIFFVLLQLSFFHGQTVYAADATYSDDSALRRTLANLALIVDTKQFSSLGQIYAADAVADYGFPVGTLTGIAAIQAGLTKLLGNIDTHHALAQSSIDVYDQTANVTTYFTLPHFGRGVYEGQLFTSWGRYEDVFVQTGNDAQDGQKGWLIQNRKIIYMGPFIGNTSITGHY